MIGILLLLTYLAHDNILRNFQFLYSKQEEAVMCLIHLLGVMVLTSQSRIKFRKTLSVHLRRCYQPQLVHVKYIILTLIPILHYSIIPISHYSIILTHVQHIALVAILDVLSLNTCEGCTPVSSNSSNTQPLLQASKNVLLKYNLTCSEQIDNLSKSNIIS